MPARNEAANIERCLDGLLRQSLPAQCITVVDDVSRDGTAAIVADVARRHGRVQLVHAPALPNGWTGKTHACWLAARASRADWLCFVDADVVAEDMLLAAAIAHGKAHLLDFLSLTPRQELVSFAERLVMPCGFYLRLPHNAIYPIAYAAETVARFTKREPFVSLDSLRMSKHLMYYSSIKAERDLAYRARSYCDGLSDALRWFSDQRYTPALNDEK